MAAASPQTWRPALSSLDVTLVGQPWISEKRSMASSKRSVQVRRRSLGSAPDLEKDPLRPIGGPAGLRYGGDTALRFKVKFCDAEELHNSSKHKVSCTSCWDTSYNGSIELPSEFRTNLKVFRANKSVLHSQVTTFMQSAVLECSNHGLTRYHLDDHFSQSR